MPEQRSRLSAAVNDIGIVLKREAGEWTCEITGIPLPADIHYAQKFLADVYRGHRKKIARSYHKTKEQFKSIVSETKAAQRSLRAAKAELQEVGKETQNA